MAAKVRVVRTATRSKLPVSHAPLSPAAASANSAALAQNGGKFPIVVVAASTGGPAAVTRLVASFPKDLPAAVLLVLHMPPTFTKQFTLQLAEISSLPVKEAESNESLQPGTIYLCPGSHHLRLSPSGRLTLDPGPRIGGYRPCADVALESVAAYANGLAIGVVLTGMGNDAAAGVKALRAAGGHVIAQDEASSVIFGMPGEAIKTGAVNEVLSLDQIGAAIEKRATKLARLVPAGVQ